MELIEAVLRACGGGVEHITMAHVYLTDNTKERFAMMNAGYLAFMGERPLPARITVGCAPALGASVEIDVVAKFANRLSTVLASTDGATRSLRNASFLLPARICRWASSAGGGSIVRQSCA